MDGTPQSLTKGGKSAVTSLQSGLAGRRPFALLAVITAFGLALRLLDIGRPLWFDEIATAEFAKMPLSRLWSMWMVRETNPPLYYTLAKGWAGLVGDGDTSLRTLSAVFGTTAIIAIYGVLAAVGRKREGISAALMLAAAPAALIYSQQVRAYGLCQLLALASILSFIRFLDASAANRPAARPIALYIAATAAALYCHTTMVVLPVLCGLFGLGFAIHRGISRALIPRLVIVNIALVALWSWWGYVTFLQGASPENISAIARLGPWESLTTTYHAYGVWGVRRGIALVVCAALFGMGAYSLRDSTALLLPFTAAGLPLVLYLLSFVTPIFAERTVFWGAAPFIATLACGIWQIGRPPISMLLIALWAAIGVGDIRALAYENRAGYPDVVLALEREPAGTTVISNSPFALRRYCAAPCRIRIIGAEGSWMNEAFGGETTAGQAEVRGLITADKPVLSLDRGRESVPAMAGVCGAIVAEWSIPAEPRITLRRLLTCESPQTPYAER